MRLQTCLVYKCLQTKWYILVCMPPTQPIWHFLVGLNLLTLWQGPCLYHVFQYMGSYIIIQMVGQILRNITIHNYCDLLAINLT